MLKKKKKGMKKFFTSLFTCFSNTGHDNTCNYYGPFHEAPKEDVVCTSTDEDWPDPPEDDT